MKILCVFVLLLSFVSLIASQDLPIIGKISDIQGKTKVYLNADSTASKTKVEKYLNKKKIFTFVSDPSEADFVLDYKLLRKTENGLNGEELSEITAYYYNAEKKKVVAWSMSKDYYKNNKRFKLPKKNEEFLANEFLAAYLLKK